MSEKTSTKSVTFDFNSRKEYLTGFKKRKDERRVRANIHNELKQKQIKREKKMAENLEKKKLLGEVESKVVFNEEIINFEDVSATNKYENKEQNITVQIQPFDFDDDLSDKAEFGDDDENEGNLYPDESKESKKERVDSMVEKRLRTLKHHPEKKKKNLTPKGKRISGKKVQKYQKLRDKVTRYKREKKDRKKK